MFIVRYYKECATKVEALTLAEAEMRARSLAMTHKWTLLSVALADLPKPMPGPGNWPELPTFKSTL